MRKVVDYYLVRAISNIDCLVNGHIKNGWQPFGSPFLKKCEPEAGYKESYKYETCQAMVMYGEKEVEEKEVKGKTIDDLIEWLEDEIKGLTPCNTDWSFMARDAFAKTLIKTQELKANMEAKNIKIQWPLENDRYICDRCVIEVKDPQSKDGFGKNLGFSVSPKNLTKINILYQR